MAEINDDPNSILKFLKGPFVLKNYAKALVLGLCLTIMVSIGFCVYSVVKAKFIKPKPIPTQQVGTNQGTITTNNSEETKKGWQLFGGLVQINN